MLTTTKVVEIKKLTRQFGKTHALDDVSLDLLPGMVYGLVGASGASSRATVVG